MCASTPTGCVSTGSALPGTDRTGLQAVLPLAVHNTWVVLHDPDGPAGAAEVLLLVGGRTDNAARERIYDDVARRLPELLSALRLRAVEAGVASCRTMPPRVARRSVETVSGGNPIPILSIHLLEEPDATIPDSGLRRFGRRDAGLHDGPAALRTARAGVDKLPRGWQFVHIDVPSRSRDRPGRAGQRAARRAAPTSAAVRRAAATRSSTARSAAGSPTEAALDTIATWAPRQPEQVTNPISVGAGQYRAIGRMITLSRAGEIRADAAGGVGRALPRSRRSREMSSLDVPGMGRFDPQQPPIVLVVSSMAGGAGASMALDVCRLLTMVSGLDPKLMGVFMVAPDIFDIAAAEPAAPGCGANALAMLGEIVASQTGRGARARRARCCARWASSTARASRSRSPGCSRSGRYIGADRTQFGDGSQFAVYRGLGRGLAGLMMSGDRQRPVRLLRPRQHRLARPATATCSAGARGVGSAAVGLLRLRQPVSMGRDRYAEYAAQRMARSCVEQAAARAPAAGQPGVGQRAARGAAVQPVARRICSSSDCRPRSGDEESRINILGTLGCSHRVLTRVGRRRP